MLRSYFMVKWLWQDYLYSLSRVSLIKRSLHCQNVSLRGVYIVKMSQCFCFIHQQIYYSISHQMRDIARFLSSSAYHMLLFLAQSWKSTITRLISSSTPFKNTVVAEKLTNITMSRICCEMQ